MNSRKIVFTFLILLFVFAASHAQKGKREPLKHEQEVRDMVKFLQYMLNTLGDAGTANRDKDVLVLESYSKIFRDAKVQVEDDLDPDRKVITNKDVQAYLKDVDFFFKDVKFEFIVNDIEASGTSGDKLYYKVSLSRVLNGTTADGKTIRNTIPRFIEINYDTKEQDLKVVSIYTHQFNEKQALMDWWNSLSYEWRSVFKNKFNVDDSVQLSDIRSMMSVDSLDLSSHEYVRDIEPVGQLNDLRFLDISKTNITDITPLRNLTELFDLDISHTGISDLTPLRYATNLNRLNVSYTKIDSLTILERFNNLHVLEAQGVTVNDFSPLSQLDSIKVLDLDRTLLTSLEPIDSLGNLSQLNIAHTRVPDLNGLKNLKKLTFLLADSTSVKDLMPLSGLKQLKVLHINFTLVSSISPLAGIATLERIYCDHTPIKQNEAAAFNKTNPNTLIIFDSEDLRGWWTDLPPVWKDVFGRRARIGMNPSKEDLAKVANLDSINISNYPAIHSLTPLAKLPKLAVLIASKSGIDNVVPLKKNLGLRVVDVSHTGVSDLGPLAELSNLVVVKAEQTAIKHIDTLSRLKNLERLYVDHAGVTDSMAASFLAKNPKALVVYKTPDLEKWWNALTPEWQEVFQKELNIGTQPTPNNFHRLVELEKLSIKAARVNDLSPLTEFVRLKELELTDTDVTTLNPVSEMQALRTLIIKDHPIRSIGPLRSLVNLQKLDISNTAVTELDVLSELKALTWLSCAGTPVKKLTAMQSLNNLEYMDCSNTEIRNLEPLFHLPLKTLKCYNSKVSKGDVEKFSKFNPECNVTFYR